VSEHPNEDQGSLPVRLQDLVLDTEDVGEFLDGLTKLAARALSTDGKDVHCGITLVRPRAKATVASSTDEALLLDEVQYAFDDGPCLRAAREGQVYTVTDFGSETRFGGYPEAIRQHGMRSALGVPIPLEGLAAAGLNLYSPQVGAFDDIRTAAAVDLARQISTSLRVAVRIAHLTDTEKQLRSAMTSRTVIDVAAGIIMGQNRCTHDTAMTILKAASNGRNVKLAEVATAVVNSTGQQVPSTHFDG
jgi:hypothetical protein